MKQATQRGQKFKHDVRILEMTSNKQKIDFLLKNTFLYICVHTTQYLKARRCWVIRLIIYQCPLVSPVDELIRFEKGETGYNGNFLSEK